MYYYVMSYEEADRRERIAMKFWLLSLILLATYFTVTIGGTVAFFAGWAYVIVSLAWRVARTELIGNDDIANDVGIDRGGCIGYRTRKSRILHIFAPFVLPFFYVRRLKRNLQRTKA